MPFHTFQLVKSLPFQIPGKGTRGERPRIELYIEYPRGSPFRSVLFFSAEYSDYGSLTFLFTEI